MAWVSVAALGAERPSLYEGLPREWPENFAERFQMLSYEAEEPSTLTENVLELRDQDGRAVRSSDVFVEKHWVYLPDSIRVHKGRWHFPSGTLFVHEIRTQDPERQFFDVRVMKKLENGEWAMGLYRPDGHGLRLHRDEGKPQALAAQWNILGQGLIHARFDHLQPQGCWTCHTSGSAPINSIDRKDLEPCDFGPESENLDRDLKLPYLERFKRPYRRTVDAAATND